QREKFLELPEIQNLFGLKGIKKFIEINENIIDNMISIEEVDINNNQIKELKELLKTEKDPKKDKKITKSIQKLEKEIYTTKYKSYQAIHKNIAEKYELYNEKIPEAKQFQENDLMLELANDYINKAINSTQQSNTIYQKIDKYESENYIINKLKEADSIDLRSLEYMELAILSYFNYEIGEDEPEIDKEIEYAKVDKEMVSDSLKMDTIPEPPKVADSEINPDTLAQALEIINNVELENIQNLEKAVQNENTSLHISKEFEILKKSPYSESNPFPIDQKLPKGINYRIQLGVYSQSMPFDSFKGLCPISIENTPNGYLKYYAGSFKRYQSAVNSLSLVRDEGFKDAFIVAFQDGIKISTDKAKGLELKDAPVINPQKPQVKDTIETKDDEIVIKIQIGAFKGQMPEDIFENFKNLAPGKIFEQYVNENGIRIYTIGNFYNFEEAQNLKKYIQEKGNDGIFLIALKNGKKIPVSEAKELLKEKR
ncbi:MAG: hypothetical protein JXB17_13695, partial [Bacteroidales bacterium]|nr:hypothetical protein [Bacteroidales bacterium]